MIASERLGKSDSDVLPLRKASENIGKSDLDARKGRICQVFLSRSRLIGQKLSLKKRMSFEERQQRLFRKTVASETGKAFLYRRTKGHDFGQIWRNKKIRRNRQMIS